MYLTKKRGVEGGKEVFGGETLHTGNVPGATVSRRSQGDGAKIGRKDKK